MSGMAAINIEDESQIREETTRILKRHGRKRGNLIPILQEIQGELGYLHRQAMQEAARFLDIPEMDVYSVVTFYNQLRLNPLGRHTIKVCLGTACHIRGSYIVLDAWKRRVGININRPALVALDGEREVEIYPQEKVEVELCRDGPRVVKIEETLEAAARNGFFINHAAQ